MAKETIASLKKQLEDANKRIEYICEAHEEELIKAGVKSRKTLMSDIEQIEEDARKTIEYTIAQCEKKTGRTLSQPVACDIVSTSGKIEWVSTASASPPEYKGSQTQAVRELIDYCTRKGDWKNGYDLQVWLAKTILNF